MSREKYLEGHYDKPRLWEQVREDSLQAQKIFVETEIKKTTQDYN